MRSDARGPNVTLTAGDVSFEQAILAASLLADERPFFLCGVDEAHDPLTALFDPSVEPGGAPADGGAALIARVVSDAEPGTKLRLLVLQRGDGGVESLVDALGGPEDIQSRYGAVLVGIPRACSREGRALEDRFIAATGFSGMVVPFREAIGEFATSSAVATALAVKFVERGFLPGTATRPDPVELDGRGILLLGFGDHLSAIEVIS